MKINNSADEIVDVFDISSGEDFPFSNTWKKTYEAIEKSLKEFGDEKEENRILEKVAKIVNILVRNGNTYEDIVLETAELYIFSKESKIDPSIFEKSYGKYVVAGVNCLNQTLNSDKNLESIFKNQDMRYLSKIKLAEYLIALSSSENVSKELLDEVDMVIETYNGFTHKRLMNLLIEQRDKIK